MSSLSPSISEQQFLHCQSCDKVIPDSPKILSCLHKLCENCLESISRKTQNGKSGIYCPSCNNFSTLDDIESNIILKDVLENFSSAYSSNMVFSPLQNIADNHEDTSIGVICRQCKRPNVTSHCMNCNRDLCDICQSTHLEFAEFQDHQIVSSRRSSGQGQSDLDTPAPSNDQLQFDLEIPSPQNAYPPCSVHKEQSVSMYCSSCRKPLCTNCIKEQHESHDIETIESALDRIKPDIQIKLDNISGKQDTIKQKRAAVDICLTQTTAVCKHVLAKAESDAEKKIAKVKKDLHALKAATLKFAKSSIEDGEKIKRKLQLTESNMENISSLGTNLLESSTETEIVFLPESDLLRKITVLSNVPVDFQDANDFINKCNIKPQFIPCTVPQENIVGQICFGNQSLPNKSQEIKLQYVTEKFHRTASLPSIVNNESGHTLEYNSRLANNNNTQHDTLAMSEESHRISNTSLTQVSSTMAPKLIGKFKLKNFYSRMSFFDHHIFCACFNKNCVDVYTKEGEWIRSISCGSIKCPRVLQPLNEQQMLVAGYSGLFCIDSNSGKVQTQVLQGMFRDVHLNNQIIAVLEKGPENKQDSIHVLEAKSPYNETSCFTLGQEAAWSVLVCENSIYVSSGSYLSSSSNIVKFNLQGDQLAVFGIYGRRLPGELCTPYLCMSDKNGALIVADHLNNRLQVIGPDGNFSLINGVHAKYPSDVFVIDDLMLVNDLNNIYLFQLHI